MCAMTDDRLPEPEDFPAKRCGRGHVSLDFEPFCSECAEDEAAEWMLEAA